MLTKKRYEPWPVLKGYRPADFSGDDLPKEIVTEGFTRGASVLRRVGGDRANPGLIMVGGRGSSERGQRLLYDTTFRAFVRHGFFVVQFLLGENFTYSNDEPRSGQEADNILRNNSSLAEHILKEPAAKDGNMLAISAGAPAAGEAMRQLMGKNAVRGVLGIIVPATQLGDSPSHVRPLQEAYTTDGDSLSGLAVRLVAATRDEYFPPQTSQNLADALGNSGATGAFITYPASHTPTTLLAMGNIQPWVDFFNR